MGRLRRRCRDAVDGGAEDVLDGDRFATEYPRDAEAGVFGIDNDAGGGGGVCGGGSFEALFLDQRGHVYFSSPSCSSSSRNDIFGS